MGIPPVLVEKYINDYDVKQKQNTYQTPSRSEEKKEKKMNDIDEIDEDQHGFLNSTHSVLPSTKFDDESIDTSFPLIMGADMAAASFYGSYYEQDEESENNKYKKSFHRPRRGSFPGCDNPNKCRIPPPLHGDFTKNVEPKSHKMSIFEEKDGNNLISDINTLEEEGDD